MTVTDVSHKIASLAEAHRETMGLIAKLRKAEQMGPNTEGAEVVALIHHNLKETEQDLELLHTQIEDEPSGERKTSLMSKWSKLSEDAKIARASYRKAQMEVKRNVDELRRRERERLLGQRSDVKRKGKTSEKLSQEELLVDASSEITSSLRRTHALMSAELSRSQFATETLAHSTLALKELSNRYSTLDDILFKSRKLITDLVRKNKSDSWYYEKALYIMIGTCIWLFVRRFLYGPFYLLVWLPLKICWWFLSWIGVIISAGGDYDSEIISIGSPVKIGKEAQAGVPGYRKIGVKVAPEELPTIPAFMSPDTATQSIDVSEEVKGTPDFFQVQKTLKEPKAIRGRAADDEVVQPPSPCSIENKPDSLLGEIGQMIDNQRYGQCVNEQQRHDEL